MIDICLLLFFVVVFFFLCVFYLKHILSNAVIIYDKLQVSIFLVETAND